MMERRPCCICRLFRDSLSVGNSRYLRNRILILVYCTELQQGVLGDANKVKAKGATRLLIDLVSRVDLFSRIAGSSALLLGCTELKVYHTTHNRRLASSSTAHSS